MPFVAQPEGSALAVSDLARRVAERLEELAPDARANAAFLKLVQGLSEGRGGVAIFSAKFCPLGLVSSSRRSFFAAMPAGNGALLIQGVLCHNLVSPAAAICDGQGCINGASPDVENPMDLGFDDWKVADVFNPNKHQAEPPLQEVEETLSDPTRVLPVAMTAQSKSQVGAAPARGRGRPPASTIATSTDKSLAVVVAGAGLPMPPTVAKEETAQEAIVKAAQLTSNLQHAIGVLPASASLPATLGAADQATEKHNLAELVPMLRHSTHKRRRVGAAGPAVAGAKSPAGGGLHLSSDDVENIAKGLFNFTF